MTLRVLFAALALTLAPATLRAQSEVPIQCTASVDSADLADTGVFTLTLACTPQEDITVPYAVRVAIWRGSRELTNRTHSPDPPTTKWKSGKVVKYSLPCSVPLDPTLTGGEQLDVRLGFVDAHSDAVFAPIGAPSGADGLADVAELLAPTFTPIEQQEQVERLLAKAKEMKGTGRTAEAWDVLERGIRLANDDHVKRRFKDELVALGPLPPRPLDAVELTIVHQRIDDERTRYLRLVAGSMHDRKRFHGAVKILEEIGGSLEERGNQAVIGALSDAERVTKDVDAERQAMLDFVPEADAAEAEKSIQALGLGDRLLDKADQFAKAGKLTAARSIYRALKRAEAQSIVEAATARIPPLEAAILGAIPKDEQVEVDAALKHPCFERTTWRASHRFVFIGPKTLVDTIPDDSIRRFDLAYVFVTDLFGRVPNPAGDRLTVYFKELWDFGGGVGGGKIIDIGNAKPDAKGMRIDNGLYYHELTHCVDDTRPVFEGFHEGLANLGAAYCFEALGQDGDSLHSFESNLAAFKADYLDRDLEYWRIPNYGPSCGFFLSFVERFAKTKDGHDWRPLRQFFREYRDAPVRDGREPFVARALAHYLMRAFGDGAFDELVKDRFPLVESDKDAVNEELDCWSWGAINERSDQVKPDRFPNSPLPRDLLTRGLLSLEASGDAEGARKFGREELGLLYDWMVVGPFACDGSDVAAVPFPPEHEIDFSKQYPARQNNALWQPPTDHPPVSISGSGWVDLQFPYMDDTATYALTNVTVDAAQDATIHARADDDVTIFLNGERLGDYRDRGWNDSTELTWRGPVKHVPDAMRFAVRLAAGRNELLVKVKNRVGGAGFVVAISRRDGTPIPGLSSDAAQPERRPAPSDASKEFVRRFHHDGAAKDIAGRFDVAVGEFRSRNKRLCGESTSKGVAWRKYTVRPGFPKDSPSNLAWLKEKATDALSDFELEVGIASADAPKCVVTFQGEGKTDGLSGWNLILEPSGARVRASLERYDHLVYQSAWTELPKADERKLVMSLVSGKLDVKLADVALFDGVAIRAIPGKTRIGFATWGQDTQFSEIDLRAPPRK